MKTVKLGGCCLTFHTQKLVRASVELEDVSIEEGEDNLEVGVLLESSAQLIETWKSVRNLRICFYQSFKGFEVIGGNLK